ncbi:DUF6056 family protein [Lacticaseibacillus sp. 866-1]|uniref:DUF6056 family protein n=1 Tax=Lacticaseibacillus sp. 866-1 TaxID=2799576 RepID=UPI0019430743|nr:DUF6056 family protein [Lacticaseibacillus sp. 866-1]
MLVKIKNNLNYLAVGAVFAFVSFWTAKTPAWSDDFNNIVNGKGLTFLQIAQTQYHRYFVWSGRVVAESIASILVSLGRIPFGVLNGLVFAIMSLLILKLAGVSNLHEPKSFIKYTFILLGLFWLMPSFGQVVLWTSGSGNYLWTATLNLAFIYYILKKVDPKKWAVLCLMIPVSFLSGASNENSGVGVIAFLLLYFALNKEQIRFMKTRLLLLLPYLLGYIFLIVAPGNSVRARVHDAWFMQFSLFDRLTMRFTGLNDIVSAKLLIPLILLILFVALRLVHKDYKFVIAEVLPYFVGAALMVYALVMSPELDPNAGRMYLLPFLFVLIATTKSMELVFDDQLNRFVLILVFMVMFLETFLSLSSGFIDSMKTNIAIQLRYDSISEQKKHYNHKRGIVVSPYSYVGQTKYSVSKETDFDMVAKPTGPYNILLSRAFGVTKISIK